MEMVDEAGRKRDLRMDLDTQLMRGGRNARSSTAAIT
jgi:hypothetical protein